jgi:uncharacterized protein (TIGR00290 family)
LKRVALSWSTGKDSAWSLHLLRQDPNIEIVAIFTTLNEQFDRVAMHAVRRELLELQAESLGLPLWTIPLPWPCSNEQYEAKMSSFCALAVSRGVEAMAFGDLFLADVRAYREKQLANTGIEPLFPLWQIPTADLARTMIASGLRAKITCVDPKVLPKEFAGRDFDSQFLADLPPDIDPCGENGEFHSFVYDGPGFQKPLAVKVVQVLEQDGFVFADLLLA